MPKLSIQMIVFHEREEKYIPFLFDSLRKQTFQDWEMVIVDNNSNGNVLQMVQDELVEMQKPHRIIKNADNVGFAEGHNRAYRSIKSEYTLLLNPDMYLMPEALERMVAFLDKHAQTSAVASRLMRWDFDAVETSTETDLFEKSKVGFTDFIDAIGIKLLRNRRSVEWLTRETWAANTEHADIRAMFDKKTVEVFGVSGAFTMMRKSMIDPLLLAGENLFDPTYHSYKEDLDLAYRMRIAGHTSYVLLDVVAYHDRTGAGPKSRSDFAALKNRKNQSYFLRFHSYKNHLRTLYKNEYWQNFLLDFPFIFWYEIKKFGYILLTQPKVILMSLKEVIHHRAYTRAAKKHITSTRKMYWKGLRRWF